MEEKTIAVLRQQQEATYGATEWWMLEEEIQSLLDEEEDKSQDKNCYKGWFWDSAMRTYKRWDELTNKPKRTFTTEVRQDWQDMIAQTLKAIDRHSKYKDDDFHTRNYYILKQYMIDLKNWIHSEEHKREMKNE